MRYEDRKPMVDQGVIGLVAICIIAKAHVRSGGRTDVVDRLLAMAISHLDANEAEVAEEIERRKGDKSCGSGPLRTATEIANGIEHPPATVSGILARLVKQGRIKRFTALSVGMPGLKPETWVY